MLNRLKKILFYAGMEPEQYADTEPVFMQENLKSLRLFTGLIAVFFLALGIVSFLTSGFQKVNCTIYLVTGASCFLLFMISDAFYRDGHYKGKSVVALILLFISIIYMESIYVTMLHKDLPAVTFIGVLLLLPLLLSVRPVTLILFQSLYVVFFCLAVHQIKNPEIAMVDIWNSITFLIISIAAISVVVPMRIHLLERTMRVEYVSEHDLLTGMKNRNAYEKKLEKLSCTPKRLLSCIFMDVNGLHEVNNTKGHDAGDILLQATATGIRDTFGKEECYRIGGDEFVALSDDLPEELQKKMEKLQADFDSRDIYVSFGMAQLSDENPDIHDVIKAAEIEMYRAKAEYYRKNGIERRESYILKY